MHFSQDINAAQEIPLPLSTAAKQEYTPRYIYSRNVGWVIFHHSCLLKWLDNSRILTGDLGINYNNIVIILYIIRYNIVKYI